MSRSSPMRSAGTPVSVTWKRGASQPAATGRVTGMAEPSGIQFPVTEDGRRSTTAVGRGVVADALRGVDPVGAGAAERETNWRTGYLAHFRRLVDAGLDSPE